MDKRDEQFWSSCFRNNWFIGWSNIFISPATATGKKIRSGVCKCFFGLELTASFSCFRPRERQVCLKADLPPLPPPIIRGSRKRHDSVLHLSQNIAEQWYCHSGSQAILKQWERTDNNKKKVSFWGKMRSLGSGCCWGISVFLPTALAAPSPGQSCLSCCHLHVTEARGAVDISHPASGLGQGEVLPVLSNTAQPFQDCL